MNWDNFKDKFHPSWHCKIKPFIESEECNKIFAFLKAESKAGKNIAPQSINLWKCFKETSLDDLKVVLMGVTPYNTIKDGLPIADGLLMGCSITEQLHPTLDYFYKGLEVDVYNGLRLDYRPTPNVSYLSHQGVLMLNASLTIEEDKIEEHLNIWEPFIQYLFENILNITGVPYVFLGEEAAKYSKYAGHLNKIFILEHPSDSAITKTQWNTKGVFKKVNELIDYTNNWTIEWLDIDCPF